MAYPAGSCRVNLSGTLPGGEIWATGFWLFDTQVGSEDEANTLAQAIAGVLGANNFDTAAMTLYTAARFSGQTTWNAVTVYYYTGGTTQAAYIGRYDLPAAVPGGGAHPLPNQCCLVLSMRTGYNGRRNRGRMYLPMTAAALDAGGELAQADVQNVCNEWVAGFNEIHSQGLGRLSVVSQVGQTDRIILEIIVDSRIDIQRRRANSEAVTFRASGQLVI